MGHFFPFDPPNNWKNQNFEKMKKNEKPLEISFYTCLPQIPGIWCMVPEISSATDILFCYFGLFFLPFHPAPPNNAENLNFEKIKKASRDIIILHISTTNKKNKMMYDSWYGAQEAERFLILHQLFHFLPWS